LIAEGKTEEEIIDRLKLSRRELDYHLKTLEWGFCIGRMVGG